MSFLPENYEAPKGSDKYMKLTEGEHRIRILSSPIMGWEDWIDGSPIRYRFDNKPSKPHNIKSPIRHFWSFIVWNYQEERIQVLHICQATIRSAIESLCKDSEWGAPFFYDIKIRRSEEKGKTKYIVNPVPHKQLDPVIKVAFYENRCNLEVIFDGGDLFGENSKYTEGVFDKNTQTTQSFESTKKEKISLISSDQAEELEEIFLDCEPKAFVKLLNDLKLNQVKDLPANLFDRMHKKASNMRQEYLKKSILDKEALDIFGALEVSNR